MYSLQKHLISLLDNCLMNVHVFGNVCLDNKLVTIYSHLDMVVLLKACWTTRELYINIAESV